MNSVNSNTALIKVLFLLHIRRMHRDKGNGCRNVPLKRFRDYVEKFSVETSTWRRIMPMLFRRSLAEPKGSLAATGRCVSIKFVRADLFVDKEQHTSKEPNVESLGDIYAIARCVPYYFMDSRQYWRQS